jgi:hypothetical protein
VKVNDLVAEINKSGTLRASIQDSKHVGTNQVQFQIKVDVTHQAPEKYTTRLVLQPQSRKGPVPPDGWADDAVNADDQGDE